MTIKVQCDCGARYAFDVEPQDGLMPFRVNCPTCGADGTEAANQVIAQTMAAEQPTRLRMKPVEEETAEPIESVEEFVAPPPIVRGQAVAKLRAEARQLRRAAWLIAGLLLLCLSLLGAWGWYSFAGSKPRLASTFVLTGPQSGWRMQLMGPGKILVAGPNRILLRDFRTRKDIWSTALTDSPGTADEAARRPEIMVHNGNIWVCLGDRVVRVDEASGAVKQTVPIVGQFECFTPTKTSILVVSARDETRRVAQTIDLATDDTTSQEVVVPRSQTHQMPNELPPNVQPTAGVLLAQALDENKFNKPLDAMSSEFFSTGQNLLEMRVKLLEPKVTWVQTIKPRGPSVINGQTTASTPVAEVESEVFNDIKRSQTGGSKGVDESRYEVKLRRWLGEKPVEWTGEVIGAPSFFSLATVDLLVAGKSLTVFDKQNNPLFSAKLSYSIAEAFTKDLRDHRVPAVERNGTLYFFDQGVLTAFSLPSGEVQWRLTSIGISNVQFDRDGMLYIDTTAASPEAIQYTEQIKVESTPPVIMKVAPQSGKILWQAQKAGQHCFLTGKYVYSVSALSGGMPLLNGLAQAVNSPRDVAIYSHIYRLNPETGHVLWSIAPPDPPAQTVFQDNWFVLRVNNEVQTWKFLSL